MDGSTAVVEFAECLDITSAQGALRDVRNVLDAGRKDIVFDLRRVEHFDSAGVGVVLCGIRQARQRGAAVELQGMSPAMTDFFSLVSVGRLTADEPPPPPQEDVISQLGGRCLPLLDAAAGVLRVALEAATAALVWPFQGRRWRLDRIALEIEQAFLGALPVVLLIGFLLGLILAMQAYVQLQVFGADLYMADMVGVSVVYEIGPLMTGIILAARSGSSCAAQLGAMVVAEEIDALEQMGVAPIGYLVLPKVVALSFAALALGLVFAAIAIVGGALFAYLAAGIETNAYMQRTADALRIGGFLVACAKGVVFGAVVGVVGCGLGLRVTGGSEGVARATTNAVVSSVFAIIVIDALFVAGQQVWPS